jgi:hypothetical protein
MICLPDQQFSLWVNTMKESEKGIQSNEQQ